MPKACVWCVREMWEAGDAVFSELNHNFPLPSSSCSKLSMYLPHKVDEDKGKAKWDKDKKVLSVTLPIIRDDEF